MSADLRVLGFERIGDLLAQPRAPLTLRFGLQLGRHIDQALGVLAEPIEPVRPPDLISMRRAFPEPIGAAETIARYIGKLTVRLCDALEETRDAAFPLPHGRGDQARHGGGPDPRELPPKGLRARNFADPYGHIRELKMKTRDFH